MKSIRIWTLFLRLMLAIDNSDLLHSNRYIVSEMIRFWLIVFLSRQVVTLSTLELLGWTQLAKFSVSLIFSAFNNISRFFSLQNNYSISIICNTALILFINSKINLINILVTLAQSITKITREAWRHVSNSRRRQM